MKCSTVNNLLDKYLIGRLSESDADSISSHLHHCPECNRKYREAKELVDILQNVKVPSMPVHFADGAIANAIAANSRRSSRMFYQVASGIAASFVVLFMLAFTVMDSSTSEPVSPIVLIENEIKTVRLAIESARAVDGIEMTIDLSENLEISGYENLKQISWRTRLEKGTNVIALPVSAIALGDGKIRARVGFKDKEKIFTFDTKHESIDSNKVEPITMVIKA